MKQNAAYVRFNIGLTGGSCLDVTRFPEDASLPSKAFVSRRDDAPPKCDAGTRFVTLTERIVRISQRYSAILGAAEREAVRQTKPRESVSSPLVASVSQTRQAAMRTAMKELDADLGVAAASNIQIFVRERMKAKMHINLDGPKPMAGADR